MHVVYLYGTYLLRQHSPLKRLEEHLLSVWRQQVYVQEAESLARGFRKELFYSFEVIRRRDL